MILQLHRLRFSHDHHHHQSRRMSQANSAALQTFQTLVSKNLNWTLESLKLGSEFLSLTWLHKCFQMVPMINNAFATLMVEIDHPVSRWEPGSIDEYLDYTINLLDLLNFISSSISHVNLARVSLTHALSLMESSPALAIERMREITKKHDSVKEFKASGGDHVYGKPNEKEWIFHEAMMVVKSIGFWVCGVVLSGLKREVDPIMEMMGKTVSMDSSLMSMDSIFKKRFMEEGKIAKEVEGVNECVRLIISSEISYSDDVMELKRRLEVVGNGLMGLKEVEEGLFGSVMAARNEVLETLRRHAN